MTNAISGRTTSAVSLASSRKTSSQATVSRHVITDVGPNHRIWQSAFPLRTNEYGRVIYGTNRFVELRTGLHHLVGNKWQESSDNIKITSWGGIAATGQHKVGFTGNINVSNAVEVLTADGKELHTHIMGMSYYDWASGSNVFFAELKDSAGQLVKSNQVVYPDAFSGAAADVRYTYRLSGLEQDIVLHDLPNPSKWGLDQSTTALQLWTEFSDSAQPNVQAITNGDTQLTFGSMKMVPGKAFVIGSESNSARVYKKWIVTPEGRSFLVEQISFNAIDSRMSTASAPGSARSRNELLGGLGGFPARLPNRPHAMRPPFEGLKLAENKPATEKGVVLDYNLVNADDGFYDFQADTTYLISGTVVVDPANVTFEGGTVLKFAENSDACLTLLGNSSPSCPPPGGPAAILTSANDDSVGDRIPNSTGNPGVTDLIHISLVDSGSGDYFVFQEMKFFYAALAISEANSPDLDLWDCQFVGCGWCVVSEPIMSPTLSLHNVLLSAGTGSGYNAVNAGITVAEQVTSDYTEITDPHTGYLQQALNCIYNDPRVNGTVLDPNGNVINAPATIFQTGGDDPAYQYYLADGSPYRGAGTTEISPGMSYELSQETTYPPLEGMIADTDNPPDIGYHYDLVDWDHNPRLNLSPVTDVTFTPANGNTSCLVSLQNSVALQFTSLVTQEWFPNPNSFITASYGDSIVGVDAHQGFGSSVGVVVTKLPTPKVSPNGGYFNTSTTVTLSKGQEDLTAMMESVYRSELQRMSDPGGLAYWVSVAQEWRGFGWSDEQIRASEINACRECGEYFWRFGNYGEPYVEDNSDTLAYSLNGGTAWIIYTGPFSVAANVSLKVRAYKSGVVDARTTRTFVPSDVGSIAFQYIPTSWLIQYFGNNYQNNPSAAPFADPDGDGLCNLMEYELGTSPVAYDSTQPGLPQGQGTSDADRIYKIPQGSGGRAPAWTWSGPAVWFEITASDSQTYTLLFHNTQPGKSYLLYSTQNTPGPSAKWILEQTIPANNTQSTTQVTVNLWGRPALNFVASFPYDYDGNGLPDYWERLVAQAVIGTLNPLGDLDSDGWNNLTEFIQGSNPISTGAILDPSGAFVPLQPY